MTELVRRERVLVTYPVGVDIGLDRVERDVRVRFADQVRGAPEDAVDRERLGGREQVAATQSARRLRKPRRGLRAQRFFDGDRGGGGCWDRRVCGCRDRRGWLGGARLGGA